MSSSSLIRLKFSLLTFKFSSCSSYLITGSARFTSSFWSSEFNYTGAWPKSTGLLIGCSIGATCFLQGHSSLFCIRDIYSSRFCTLLFNSRFFAFNNLTSPVRPRFTHTKQNFSSPLGSNSKPQVSHFELIVPFLLLSYLLFLSFDSSDPVYSQLSNYCSLYL